MKNTTKTLLIAVLALAAATPALAGHGHGKGYGKGRIFDRLERQHYRIEQGIESGELTRKEARRLKKQQRRIRHLAYDLSEDGRLGRRDRRMLNEKLDRASNRIYRLKHNDATRYRKHYRYYSHWSKGGDEVRRYSYTW